MPSSLSHIDWARKTQGQITPQVGHANHRKTNSYSEAAPKCQAKEPRAPDNVAAVAAANVAKANAFAAAEAPKQSSVDQARDTFRGTGEANISL